MVSENGIAVSGYFSWQRKVFQAMQAVHEVTFAEVPVKEDSSPSEYIVSSIEVSGVQLQVYTGAGEATLRALLRAAKLC